MKKYLMGLAFGLILIPGAFVSAQVVDIATLQAQIAYLQAQIAALYAGGLDSGNIIITPVSATLVTQYNPSRPATPFLIATHTLKIKPTQDGTFYCDIPRLRASNSSVYYGSTSQETCTVLGGVSNPYGGTSLKANTEYTYSVSLKVDTNEMFQGVYTSSLENVGYHTDQYHADNHPVTNSVSPQITVVGETAPYITSINQSGDIISIIGNRFNNTVTVSVGDKTFTVSAQPTASTDVTDVVSFSQSAKQIPNGMQRVVITDTKGNSNNYYFNVGGSSNTVSSISNLQVSGLINNAWTRQTSQTVTWQTTGSVPYVDLFICIKRPPYADGCITTQKLNYPNTGSASLWIGTNVDPNTKAYIKIRPAGTKIDTLSSLFDVVDSGQTATNPNIIVTSPKSGEVLPLGSTYNIQWNGQNGASYLILLEDQNGFGKGTINASVSGSSYVWTVGTATTESDRGIINIPVAPGTYKIQVLNRVTGSQVSDQSSGLFTITSGQTISTPTIQVTSPTAGSQLIAGQPITIVYMYTGFPRPVNVEIQLNKNATYPNGPFNPVGQVITAYTPGTGSYTWTIPQSITPGQDYSFLVSTDYPSTETGYSAHSNNFSIVAPTVVTPKLADSGVSSPTGSTVVQGTNLTNLTWATVGSIPNVDVLVCIQNGSCFYAQKGIANENGRPQVRVGTNIPVGSKVFVRVQQAGNPAIKIDSRTFDVVAPTTTQTSSVYFAVQQALDAVVGNLSRE